VAIGAKNYADEVCPDAAHNPNPGSVTTQGTVQIDLLPGT